MSIHPGLPKLVATDLDGTLVRSDDTVSAYTHEVLARVKAAGIPLVGATGRGPRLIDTCREFIPEADFLVLAQGARVVDLTDPSGPATLRGVTVDGAVIMGLLEALEAIVGPLSVMVEAGDEPGAPLWGEAHPAWRYPDALERRARHEALAGPVIKAFAHSHRYDPDELVAIARTLIPADGVTVTQAGLGYIEICPPGVTKATGLAVVADSLGVDPRSVLVFGDMPNDLPMFGWAGWSRVAVAGAHPEVRAVADEITLSNDADGVAVYLDRLLSNG
ncbi:MAG: haloacid dehalogenase [Actinobacteria bacterium 13_1_20CM_3_71_11]|nr:MAG: haloacid dehalogenase [Actinobacteria bacterium 13_1_20CM_3_71_11]